MDLSIVIPAYNEAERLPSTLRAIADHFKSDPRLYELVVVDDGSTDGTADLVRQIFPSARVIRQERNRGKGAAVRTGMLAARGQWRYLCDADLSTPIAALEDMWALRERYAVIIGSRRMPGAKITRHQAIWKEKFGQVGNLLIQILATPGIKDSQCGFKLFNARAAQLFSLVRNDRWGYDFEILFLTRRYGFPLVEIAVEWQNDARSKVRTRDYFTTFGELLKIRLNAWRGIYPRHLT